MTSSPSKSPTAPCEWNRFTIEFPSRPRFAGVNTCVASTLRIERRFCARQGKVRGAEVQFPQAVHLRRSLLPHVLLRRSAHIAQRRSSNRKETKQCCEAVPPENNTA